MTSPYRRGVNSYILHCHSLFQASRTRSEVDIIYSLLKFFIYTSRYTENTTSTRLVLVVLTFLNSLSDLMEVAQEQNLNFCKTAISPELLLTFSGYFQVAVVRCWESGFSCRSRDSYRIGKRPRKRSRTLKGVFNVKATLMSIWWNCSRSAIRAKTIVIHTKRKH